jgi:hypothetical protein
MKASLVILACAPVLIAGCLSRHSQSHPPGEVYEQRRTSVAEIDVPLPTVTPYDSDQDARKIYLSAYYDGYKTGLTGITIRYLFPQQPHRDALVAGCYDGQAAGQKASPYRLELQH